MNLRGNNFVSQIFHISVIKATIEGLLGGDRYYFQVCVNGASRVFYIDVEETVEGAEIFRLFKDNSKYGNGNFIASDGLIKGIHNSATSIGDSKVYSYSQTPAKDMAEYVLVYIDAMQTAS